MAGLNSTPAMTVAPSMTASQLATFMASTRQKAAAVVDKAQRVIGVVSARDVLTRVLATSKDPSAYTVESFMTSKPLVITEAEWSANPDVARRKMTERGFRHIPIVEDNNSKQYKNILTLMGETREWFIKQGENNFSEKLQKVGNSLAKLFGISDETSNSSATEKQKSQRILSWRLCELFPAESSEIMLSCEDTLQSAVQFMATNGVGAVLVHRPENPYVLAGVLSETDVVVRALSQYATETNLLERPIEEFWTTGGISTLPMSATLEEALKIMLRNSYRHIPIVDPQTQVPKLLLDIVAMVRCLLGSDSRRSGSFDSAYSEEEEFFPEAASGDTGLKNGEKHAKSVPPGSPVGTPSVSTCFPHEICVDAHTFGQAQRTWKRLEDGNKALRQFDFNGGVRKFQIASRMLDSIIPKLERTDSEFSETDWILLSIFRCLRMKALSHLSRSLFVAEVNRDARNVNTIYEAIQHARDAVTTHESYVGGVRQAVQKGYRVETGEEYTLYPSQESSDEDSQEVLKVSLLPTDAKFLFELDLCDYLIEANEFEGFKDIMKKINIGIFSEQPCKASAATQGQVKKLILGKLLSILETAENSQTDVYDEIHSQDHSQLSESEKDYLLTKAMRAIEASREVIEYHSWALSETCEEGRSIQRAYQQLQSPQQMHYRRALETAKAVSESIVVDRDERLFTDVSNNQKQGESNHTYSAPKHPFLREIIWTHFKHSIQLLVCRGHLLPRPPVCTIPFWKAFNGMQAVQGKHLNEARQKKRPLKIYQTQEEDIPLANIKVQTTRLRLYSN
eukprot:gb/GECG01015797.1/.p1 GENE.gb/GECG01015797.1/~~gb/GECG01015797.1/.p1  ORF type:complete len:795 (+),score=104.62 gb/GECG01015797.1/:1-2385(+)